MHTPKTFAPGTFAPGTFSGVRPLPPDRRVSSRGVFARAVGSFVPKLAGKAFEKYGFHSAEIMTAWPRVVGAELAKFTAPERIKWPRGPANADGTGVHDSTLGGATLVIRVEPARALDVEYRSAEIVDRINRYFGYRAIGALKLVQAPLLGSRPGEGAIAASLNAAQPAPMPISVEVDPGLRAALEALWASVAAKRPRS